MHSDTSSTPWASLRLNGGPEQIVAPGDFIGRSPMATLHIDDPTISEAHAFVSLRGKSLLLLALRGRFSVNAQPLTEVDLRVGLRIELAPTISLTVDAVRLPAAVFALEHPSFGRIIPAPVASFGAGAEVPRPGWSPTALAILWRSETGLKLRRPGEGDQPLDVGDTFSIEGETWRVVSVPLDDAGLPPTALDPSQTSPLRMILRYDSVHFWLDGRACVVSGIPARILTELALAGVPIEWYHLARTIWSDDHPLEHLRMLWDGALGRLRRRLRAIGVRETLLQTDGSGRIELLLGPNDKVQDAT